VRCPKGGAGQPAPPFAFSGDPAKLWLIRRDWSQTVKSIALAIAALIASPAAALPPEAVLMAQNPAERAFQEHYGYADAVIAGDTVYLSGLVAGLAPGETSMIPAYERAFARLDRILTRAGVTWADVVDITSFHTDVKAQLDAMAAVKARYIKAPFPAWTAIGVSRLLPDTGITEIKLVARKPPVKAGQ
jgi:enamine deaminase RidA (YjgF/YER057c/UK114 family)